MHAQDLFEALSASPPDHFKYLPCTPWSSLQETLGWIETVSRAEPVRRYSDPNRRLAQLLNPLLPRFSWQTCLFYIIRDIKGPERKIAGMCVLRRLESTYRPRP